MSKNPFMPLWVADFVGDTLDLDAKEVGAYMLILMTLWTRGGYLPHDEKKLQRVARCGRDWPKVWETIKPFFTVEGESITQDRLLKELEKVASKRAVNSQSGSLGGKAKALKDKEQGVANATVSLQQPEPYLDKKKEREPNGSPKKGSRLPEDWVLPRTWGEWAVEQGLSVDTVRRQGEMFRDYWIAQSGAKAVKLDWLATWRNWIRSHLSRSAPRVIPQSDFWAGGGKVFQ
jgi:uncharacterized protein YdaU (DUF1376 family)